MISIQQFLGKNFFSSDDFPNGCLGPHAAVELPYGNASIDITSSKGFWPCLEDAVRHVCFTFFREFCIFQIFCLSAANLIPQNVGY